MVFRPEDIDRGDYRLLQNSSVVLYFSRDIFRSDRDMLARYGYRILEISCADMATFRKDISRALNWRAQFGYDEWTGNFDALRDGFSEEPHGSADDNVLVIEGFQTIVAADPEFAKNVLDIVERASRDALLFGKRLIALVRTDDPRYSCDGIGGTSAEWNPAEWQNSARGL